MNLKELKELIELIKDTGVTELEVERSGSRVRIRQDRTGPAPAHSAPMAPVPTPQTAGTAAAAETAAVAPVAETPRTGLVAVTSPVVGTFYRAAAPDSDNYADIGSVVRKGQVVCIIEAMKLMNEIESEWEGTVVEILVENAQPVEFGQKLFLIEPTSPPSS